MTLHTSAYLCDVWRGAVEAIPKGQWDASAALGLHYLRQLRLVNLPQAVPSAIPPTVGFLVQLVKSTALASILGYRELTKTAQILTNATFQPFLIFALAALIYFALCYPLTAWSRALERKVARSR
jgi:polar amino acid transport system permease protein